MLSMKAQPKHSSQPEMWKQQTGYITLQPFPGPNSTFILCYFYFSYQWAPGDVHKMLRIKAKESKVQNPTTTGPLRGISQQHVTQNLPPCGSYPMTQSTRS